MANSDPQACNRSPFVSESGCDRGNVDIHMFDDLPFCEKMDPSLPDIPPEIVDTPIDIPVPPACTCINIDYDLKLRYTKSRTFKGQGQFRADGDCCEGRYATDLSLQVPCPIKDSGKKIKVAIDYGKGPKAASAEFLKADSDSCIIEAKSANLNLNIPCPVKGSGKKIKVGIGYGKGAKTASASFIRANESSCTVEALDANLNLNIPCPVKGSGKKIKVGIGYGNGPKSASASLLEANSDSCTIEAKSVNLNLNIPCPVIGRADVKRIKTRIKYGGESRSVSVSFMKVNPEDCTIEPQDAVLRLDIPCPIKGNGCTKMKVRRRRFDSWVSSSICIAKMNAKDCTIEMQPINIEIPCPIGKTEDDENKLKVKVKWGSSSTSIKLLERDSSHCTLAVTDNPLNIEVPCPISKERLDFGTKGLISIDADDYDPLACKRTITFNVDIGDIPGVLTKLSGGGFGFDADTCCSKIGSVMVCGEWYIVEDHECRDGYYYLKIEFESSSTKIKKEVIKTNYPPEYMPSDDTVKYIPIYYVEDCQIVKDYRGAFAVQCWE